MKKSEKTGMSRREAIQAVLGVAAMGTMLLPKSSYASAPLPFSAYGSVKITRLETFLVKPRWIFLKIHTNSGIFGLGEPLLEGRALTIKTAIQEVEPYLIGKDPRQVVHHWQAIYRHAFYRGGPILTSALSGIDQALWDIKGKLLGVPVHELFGGPTRDRVRVYGRAANAEDMKKRKEEGFTVIKTGVAKKNPANIVENPAFIKFAADNFASLREAGGPEMDIAIDFHGAISQQTSKVLIKELEQYQPMFVEEPCQAQNVDTMVDIARGMHIPIATGERIFTKWGFREILEKGAASIVQPDLCHAGGITEGRIIAGMAEAYYVPIAPHNPMGPISLATGLQLAASVPNFLVQEQVSLGEGYLKNPFKLQKDGTVMVPKTPGLGIELDEDKMKEMIGHDWKNPESYNALDGSVVDW
ncbi:galactonate dehydratase [Dyadobacter sediminis]|uniref:Galactonate dehydratase n=1 Tax=Dyadobacter sediminis TaxID=1493691 RepID=A0A5R9KFM5_9BACT|nr:galactonate dehydratase [Dyadobacter sediminis]TLU94851.1 galactonate dehydratase [Dyadobacter sediminis]GGB87414.1 galactonate dehydratase [Dyadobacter sediminis]